MNRMQRQYIEGRSKTILCHWVGNKTKRKDKTKDLLDKDGNLVIEDLGKAEISNEHFASVFSVEDIFYTHFWHWLQQPGEDINTANDIILKFGNFPMHDCQIPQIEMFTWPTWGLPGADRAQVGPILVPWTLLSGTIHGSSLSDNILITT